VHFRRLTTGDGEGETFAVAVRSPAESHGKVQKGTESYGKVRKPNFFDLKMPACQRLSFPPAAFFPTAPEPRRVYRTAIESPTDMQTLSPSPLSSVAPSQPP
jgi:hypothetical protein